MSACPKLWIFHLAYATIIAKRPIHPWQHELVSLLLSLFIAIWRGVQEDLRLLKGNEWLAFFGAWARISRRLSPQGEHGSGFPPFTCTVHASSRPAVFALETDPCVCPHHLLLPLVWLKNCIFCDWTLRHALIYRVHFWLKNGELNFCSFGSCFVLRLKVKRR